MPEFRAAKQHKILALLSARLAAQGFAGHLIQFEAGFAPSSSPCIFVTSKRRVEFFDRLKQGVHRLANSLPSYDCFRQSLLLFYSVVQGRSTTWGLWPVWGRNTRRISAVFSFSVLVQMQGWQLMYSAS